MTRDTTYADAETFADPVETHAAASATEAIAERLDYHLRGAWRAGYDYVHVFHPLPDFGGVAPDDLLDHYSVSIAVFVTDGERPPSPEGYRYQYTYDLTNVDVAEVRAVLGGDA